MHMPSLLEEGLQVHFRMDLQKSIPHYSCPQHPY